MVCYYSVAIKPTFLEKLLFNLATNALKCNKSIGKVKTTICVTIMEFDEEKTVYFKDVLSVTFINKIYYAFLSLIEKS